MRPHPVSRANELAINIAAPPPSHPLGCANCPHHGFDQSQRGSPHPALLLAGCRRPNHCVSPTHTFHGVGALFARIISACQPQPTDSIVRLWHHHTRDVFSADELHRQCKQQYQMWEYISFWLHSSDAFEHFGHPKYHWHLEKMHLSGLKRVLGSPGILGNHIHFRYTYIVFVIFSPQTKFWA